MNRPKSNNSIGRPRIEEVEKLKPRFTLNLSDSDYSMFLKAVENSGLRRSEFARQAITNLIKKYS